MAGYCETLKSLDCSLRHGDIASLKVRSSLFWCAAVLLLLIIVLAVLYFPTHLLPDEATVASAIERAGLPGLIAFFMFGVGFTAVGLPRQLIAFVAGFVLGVIPGVLFGTVAAASGCALCYFTSRRFLRDPVSRRFPQTIEMLDRFVTNDVFLKILVLRLQPLGTNLITNLSAGVSRIDAPVFLMASAVGYIPQMVVFALLGAGIRVGSSAQTTVSVVLLGVSIVLGGWLYRRHVKRAQAVL